VGPKVAMAMSPCWKLGKFLVSYSIPEGLKKMSMS
jgi:hypothetical protein